MWEAKEPPEECDCWYELECEGADCGESEDEETSSIYSCPCPGCAATPPTQTNIREIINSKKPMDVIQDKKCKKCAYYDLCYI